MRKDFIEETPKQTAKGRWDIKKGPTSESRQKGGRPKPGRLLQSKLQGCPRRGICRTTNLEITFHFAKEEKQLRADMNAPGREKRGGTKGESVIRVGGRKKKAPWLTEPMDFLQNGDFKRG